MHYSTRKIKFKCNCRLKNEICILLFIRYLHLSFNSCKNFMNHPHSSWDTKSQIHWIIFIFIQVNTKTAFSYPRIRDVYEKLFLSLFHASLFLRPMFLLFSLCPSTQRTWRGRGCKEKKRNKWQQRTSWIKPHTYPSRFLFPFMYIYIVTLSILRVTQTIRL